MPNELRADPTPPPHHGQGRGGSKKESFSLRVSPALHPPERPSPRYADTADHGLGRETREIMIGIYSVVLIVINMSPGRGINQGKMGQNIGHANLCLRFVFVVFCFFVFWCLCVAQKTSTSLLICSLYS